jgi:hypothetical protein
MQRFVPVKRHSTVPGTTYELLNASVFLLQLHLQKLPHLRKQNSHLLAKTKFLRGRPQSSVADLRNFGTDPDLDPGFHTSD